MNKFGSKIRQLRTSKKIPLRKLAAFLDIDASILSKIERGKRPATREMALKMSTFFEIDTQTLLNEYLSDKIVNLIYEENDCNEILKLAEEKVEYLKKTDR
jgi:transcriptional regulator with XRE-family HTH domain